MTIDISLLELYKIKSDYKIGIFLSGGTDSALLLYLVGKYINNKIYPITVPKHDGAVNYIKNIIEWVQSKTNRGIEEPIIIGNPNLYHAHILGDAINRCIGHNIADIYYIGDNLYPQNILPNGPVRVKATNKNIIYPLFNLYKTDIIQLYVEYGIEELLRLTHTCTELAIGRCNNCWQCKERSWAFKELNLVDIGIL